MTTPESGRPPASSDPAWPLTFAQWGHEVVARLDGRTGEGHLSVHLRRGVRTTAFGPNGVRHWTVPFAGGRAEVPAALPPYARDPVDTACQALRSAAAADADGDLAIVHELAGRLLRRPAPPADWTAYLSWLRMVNAIVVADTEVRLVDRMSSRLTISVPVPGTAHMGKASICRVGAPPEADDPDVEDALRRAADQTSRLRARPPMAAAGALVLAPAAAGTFVHEVVGHLLEADNAAHGVLGPPGSAVSGSGLTVTDRGDRAAGWGGLAVDDEGQTTQAVTLLRSGVVEGTLTDLGTSPAGGGSSNGHARRATYGDDARPRICRLDVRPGTDSPADAVASVREGYLVEDIACGYVNPRTGAVRLVVREARRIDHGHVTDRYACGGEVRSDARTALRDLSFVGNDPVSRPSICMKDRQEANVLDCGVTLAFPASTWSCRP